MRANSRNALVEKALQTVSVVMMASAASSQLSGARSAYASGNPLMRRSTGSCSMMTPVLKGSTASVPQPTSSAAFSQVFSAFIRPVSPVPALAMPVLTTMARTALVFARCARQTCTGAAAKRFRVKTPATVEPSARRTSSRSRRPGLRMPARAVPSSTPSTGKIIRGSGLFKLTAMTVSPILF